VLRKRSLVVALVARSVQQVSALALCISRSRRTVVNNLQLGEYVPDFSKIFGLCRRRYRIAFVGKHSNALQNRAEPFIVREPPTDARRVMEELGHFGPECERVYVSARGREARISVIPVW
jgi:hypothetical protein